MTSPFRRLLLIGLLAVALPQNLDAQRIVLGGRGPLETDTLLQRIARTPGWVVLSRDTTIEPGQTLSGPVLVAGSSVRFAGTIPGDLVIVDGNVFVRPQARIEGNVINIGGGFFRSTDAAIAGELIEYRDALYRVTAEEDAVRITGIDTPSAFALDGFRGVVLPLYDRVNGITVRGGARWYMPRLGTVDPMLHVGASYATERERAGWSGEFSLRSRAFEVGIGAERAAVTNNEWIRSDFENSLFFAFSGRDYRDYYEADRYFAHIGYQWTRRSVDFSAGMRFQVEDARSLPTFGDAWSLVDDEPDRPNPSIDHGRITSLQGSLGVSWDGNTIEGSASLGLEGAARVAGGDFAFGRFEIDAVAALAALANHSLLVEWRARGPIPGTDSLPQQRWSALGGRGTLYTHDILSLRGDRMVYLETEYLIPIPVLESAPIIGRPAIGLVHHAGMSWSSSQPREFEQNLGLRLRLRLLWVLGMIDPEDTDRNGLFIGIGLPLRYPWWPDTL